ncbi:helix-turn-helix domain-containing protein [Micrococcaceae bacterium Sec5.7]
MSNDVNAGDGTVKQVAEFLGIHPEAVRIMARSGQFPHAYMPGQGARIKIPWTDVEGYCETHPTGEGDATVNQVAAFLNHHPESIRIMARSGAFPNAYKAGMGRKNSPLRIPWADVDRYRQLQPRVNR